MRSKGFFANPFSYSIVTICGIHDESLYYTGVHNETSFHIAPCLLFPGILLLLVLDCVISTVVKAVVNGFYRWLLLQVGLM